jgi:methionine biosynthesis protein MetW
MSAAREGSQPADGLAQAGGNGQAGGGPGSAAGSASPVLAADSLRPDLQAIAGLVPRGSTALDLGCGDGALLAHLAHHQGVRGRGIELSEAGVLACVRRGLSVRQGNLQEGLADYPDKSIDTVILSQTIQFLSDPVTILGEMLRVGRRAIVSFPNWGFWRARLDLLTHGRAPEAPDYPQPWHAAPRWQILTAADFLALCAGQGITVESEVYLSGERRVRTAANLRARTAVFALSRPLR